MGNRRCMNSICILCLLFLMTFFSGCATYTYMASDFYINPPAGKIPMRVGLYMSPAFRNPVYTYAARYTFPLGEEIAAGMAAGAEQALKESFQEVNIIDEVGSTDLSKHGVSAIIVPEMIEASMGPCEGCALFEAEYEFVCKWTVYGAGGKILYMNTFSGTGRYRTLLGSTRFQKGMTLAIRDNYQKFITHMLLTKWWEGIEK